LLNKYLFKSMAVASLVGAGALTLASPATAYETDDDGGGGGMVPSVSGSEGAGYEVQSLTTSGKIPCQN